MGKSGPNATFDLFLSWVGSALASGVGRFHDNIYFEVYVFQPNMFLGTSQTPSYDFLWKVTHPLFEKNLEEVCKRRGMRLRMMFISISGNISEINIRVPKVHQERAPGNTPKAKVQISPPHRVREKILGN